jgi:hypothetical protein
LPPLTDYIEFNQKLLPVFLLGRERWDEASEAALHLARGKWPATRAVGQALLGHALLVRGHAAEARAALEAAEREVAEVPAAAAGTSVSRGQTQPWVDTLRGELLLREGDRAEGRRVLEGVARTLRGLPGPDAWIQALFRLEAMARTARDAGEWGLAGFLADQMIEHDAAYGGSHLARALVAEHRGDRAQAAAARAEAARYWADADPDLPELAVAKAAAAR